NPSKPHPVSFPPLFSKPYEDAGVAEYWIVDVENAQVLAYQMSDRGSLRIDPSLIFPGLDIAILNETLQRSRHQDQSQVGAGLMAQFHPET
ncbi:MAG: Uma2 family endonuclease, partial [Phormidium sp. BM_Day4_Bin.17]|nr:Uma2 family endonuclease [Phormidium sp. BM_Day4_Bin.17]